MKQEINISTAKEVKGRISVHLYKATLNEALDAITNAGRFSYQKRGNLYYIYKSGNAIDPFSSNLEMRIFKLKYAETKYIQQILDSMSGMRAVKIHKPSKTVIVEDTEENINKIERLINQWDVMPRQVVIEAKILEITLNDDMAMGVNWERVTGNARLSTGGLSRAVQPGEVGEMISPVPGVGAGFFANFITGIGRNFDISAALDALQTETNVDTLSTPKIIAIHGKPAKVQVGGEQGYRVTTVSDGISQETIEFIQTGTILEITPYINDNGKILLNVKPSIQSATIEENGVPIVNTTEVATWLIADNGETVFIGGLIQDEKIMESRKVPLLGDIPLLGGLFSRLLRDTRRSELVVLITPRIIDEDQGIWTQEAIEKTIQMERNLYKEPLPDYKQFFDLLSPKSYDKDKDILKSEAYEENKKVEQYLQKEPLPDYRRFYDLLSPGDV
ncbi:type II secretory pathway, component HofQ [Candidatus Scalindua japonica]|uniref:Type II secretory pathway, component HofQ n=2 Tax=Candidatus Scalindua japonica TaxID=1284222 RepID=A0A286TTL2_9BACT|nr:type II secretory pathway, component HofQ [Candidatus Scalindua japonica]